MTTGHTVGTSAEQEATIQRFASIISSQDSEIVELDEENFRLRSALRAVRAYLLGPAEPGLFDKTLEVINEAFK